MPAPVKLTLKSCETLTYNFLTLRAEIRPLGKFLIYRAEIHPLLGESPLSEKSIAKRQETSSLCETGTSCEEYYNNTNRMPVMKESENDYDDK